MFSKIFSNFSIIFYLFMYATFTYLKRIMYILYFRVYIYIYLRIAKYLTIIKYLYQCVIVSIHRYDTYYIAMSNNLSFSR